nr:MAG TPA: hypothetical protein [Caudoviricetes sp.]
MAGVTFLTSISAGMYRRPSGRRYMPFTVQFSNPYASILWGLDKKHRRMRSSFGFAVRRESASMPKVMY